MLHLVHIEAAQKSKREEERRVTTASYVPPCPFCSPIPLSDGIEVLMVIDVQHWRTASMWSNGLCGQSIPPLQKGNESIMLVTERRITHEHDPFARKLGGNAGWCQAL